MQKIKIILTAEVGYTPNPKFYHREGNESPPTMEEMLKIDLAQAEDDTLAFLDNDNVKWSIIGRVCDE